MCAYEINKYHLIRQKLIEWYHIHKRNLPWRNSDDPYKIWISEIILQQTRVAQGLPYYNRFIERFPNINSLANANEQEVLTVWQGLGYYYRARNLHKVSKIILEKYKGIFPRDYQTIIQLKGIGEYTAAAISSFAWNIPYPAIDGNVFRFLSRLFTIKYPINTGKGKKYFTQIATQLIDTSQSRTFNQAIMEFGALQCIPLSPNCSICPFMLICLAFTYGIVSKFPIRKQKKNSVKIYLHYFHIIDDLKYLYLYLRREKGIWQNLFEFPVIESERPLNFQQLNTTILFQKWFSKKNIYRFDSIPQTKKHILSHRILYASFYKVYTKAYSNPSNIFIKIKKIELKNYPIHKLMQSYLDEIQ